jgi:hypothetical protein
MSFDQDDIAQFRVRGRSRVADEEVITLEQRRAERLPAEEAPYVDLP